MPEQSLISAARFILETRAPMVTLQPRRYDQTPSVRSRANNRAAEAPGLSKVAFLGNYIPRRCGLATFTADLRGALVERYHDLECPVVAVNDRPFPYIIHPRFALKSLSPTWVRIAWPDFSKSCQCRRALCSARVWHLRRCRRKSRFDASEGRENAGSHDLAHRAEDPRLNSGES